MSLWRTTNIRSVFTGASADHVLTSEVEGAILVVEDDPVVARVTVAALPPTVPTFVTNTADEAIEWLRTKPSLRWALVDLQLGNDDQAGLQVLDVAVAERVDVTCIVVSGLDDQGLRRDVAHRRALFLPKPFGKADVAAVLEQTPPTGRRRSYVKATVRELAVAVLESKAWEFADHINFGF